jgi:hypothetical protein
VNGETTLETALILRHLGVHREDLFLMARNRSRLRLEDDLVDVTGLALKPDCRSDSACVEFVPGSEKVLA